MSEVPEGTKRKSFSSTLPALQVAWDSTSMGAFKTCPRKYYLSIVMGYRSRAQSFHLRFGTLYHRALEVYDHKRSAGLSHEVALRASLWDLRDGALDRDGETVKFWETGDSNKNVPNLFRTVIWYLDRFNRNAPDALRTLQLANGKPAVELSFRFALDMQAPTGEDFLYCGHMDRMVEFQDKLWVLDRKTTKHTLSSYYLQQFNPSNQITGYVVAGNIVFNQSVSGAIIDAAQVAVGFSRFERAFTTRTESQLEEWLDGTRAFIQQAARYAEAGKWPMNEMSCGNYGGCEFRGICSRVPEVRERWLAGEFNTKVKWDPLHTRGDI